MPDPTTAAPATEASSTMAANPTAAIERTLQLTADPERVWRALTKPAELASWFGTGAELEPREGADGWLSWPEHGRFAIRIERFEPPARLAWRWAREADTALEAGETTLVEWTLEPGPGGGTTLSLRESGFSSAEWREGNVVGWLDELSELLGLVATEPWQAGIRRKLELRAAPDKVWRAFASIDEFDAWWGPTEGLEPVAGSEGWFVWDGYGRFAARIERVEPERFFAWRWATAPGVALADAPEAVLTEWAIVPRDGGGTDLHLLETGFAGPKGWKDNSDGWDGDALASLRRHLGEAD